MTQMNARLEIASRLMAGWYAAKTETDEQTDAGWALDAADALIAEEARTRPPAAAVPTKMRGPTSHSDDDLRAVAEELMSALDDAVDVGIEGHATTKKALAALSRARTMGLGGGK